MVRIISEVSECTPRYPDHMVSPEDFLHFVELDEFRDDWEHLGLDVENDLWALQIAIMTDPEAAPVISGTGGLRKIRFAPSKWSTGKSGAVRVCYAYLKEHFIVLLVMAYGKNEKPNLSAEEKSGVKEYISKIKKSLDKKKYT